MPITDVDHPQSDPSVPSVGLGRTGTSERLEHVGGNFTCGNLYSRARDNSSDKFGKTG